MANQLASDFEMGLGASTAMKDCGKSDAPVAKFGDQLETALAAEDDTHAGRSGLMHVVVNIICTTVGVGLVGLPVALAQSGWLLGVGGMIIACIVSIYCGVILWRTLNVYEKPIPTFMDLGYEVAGRFGQIITGFSVYGTCVGASILFIVLAAEQFQTIFGYNVMSSMLWSFIFIAIVLPFAFIKTLSHVAIVAFFGALASAVVFFVVVVQDIIVAVDHTGLTNLDTSTDVVNTDNPMDIFSAITTFFFSFGASVIFAESNVEMKNRSRFPLAVTISYGFALFVYIVLSCLSYGVYGRSLLTVPGGSIIGALPTNWATKAMAAMFLVHLLSAFLVLLNPVFRAIETATGSDNHRLHLVWRVLQRTLLIGVCYVVAIAIPFFGAIMSLLGATTITLSSFVLPCAFYLAMYWRPRGGNKGNNSKDDDSITEISDESATTQSGAAMFTRSDTLKKNAGESLSGITTDTSVNVPTTSTRFTSVSSDAPSTSSSRGPRKEHHVPMWEVVLCIAIIVVTTVLGVIGTYQAIATIVKNASTYTFF